MADKKISQLPASTVPLAGTEELAIVQSGDTKKVSVANLTAGRSTFAAGILSVDATSATVASSGTGGIRDAFKVSASGNGGSGRGTGVILSAPGSSNAVDVAKIVGRQNNAAATATAASFGIQVANSGGTLTEYVTVDNAGNTNIVAGNLVIGASGKGIDFSADGSATGMTSELLDDYEEGTWTPALSFQTPGDLSVSYTAQVGSYTKIGNRVILQGFIVTSAFTHTTASGYLKIDGIPFNGTTTSSHQNYGPLAFKGITKVGYTNFVSSIENGLPSSILVYCSASGVASSFVSASDMPTGGSVQLKFTMSYETA